MALHTLLTSPLLAHPFLGCLIVPLLLLLTHSAYRISSLHPLSHIPGPLLARLSSLWLTYHAWIGDEASCVHQLHEHYGPIVRTGPNSVDIADGEALQPIYVEKGGFLKAEFYGNFDIDGHKTIFSDVDPGHRARRAKAVAALFSTTSLRQGQDTIDDCVSKFVSRLQQESAKGEPVNVLNLTRALALDVVSSYLLGKRYGGLDEDRDEKKAVKDEVRETAKKEKKHGTEMSASGMVDTFVAVGRFWYLPSLAFQWLEWAETKLKADPEVVKSMELVDDFVGSVVDQAQSQLQQQPAGEKTTITTTTSSIVSFPARLLAAGLSPSETRAQCKDLVFAGTDSTGMNLATIVFHLARNPDIYARLQQELLHSKSHTSDDGDHDDHDATQSSSLPYLRAVVKEGLRLSMANPSRLPRVVPPTVASGTPGWTFKSTYFPPGTVVSCTPYSLHLNSLVFADAHTFNPSRWLSVSESSSPSQSRDFIPFGLGSRQCIARNLATLELHSAVQKLVEADVLRGARACTDKIEILEWFNSRVIGEKVEIVWD